MAARGTSCQRRLYYDNLVGCISLEKKVISQLFFHHHVWLDKVYLCLTCQLYAYNRNGDGSLDGQFYRLKCQLSRANSIVLSQVIARHPFWNVCLFNFQMTPETNETNDASASNSESKCTQRALGRLMESAVSSRAPAGGE